MSVVEVSIDDMYSTAEGYYTSATGVYINMGNASLYGGYVSLTALEPLTQQYTVSGNNETRRSWAAYEYTSETSKPIIEEIWLGMYNNIFNANLVIDKLRHEERPLFEEGGREIMLAEMLAMRGYMYFDLVRIDKIRPGYFAAKVWAKIQSEQAGLELMKELGIATESTFLPLPTTSPVETPKNYVLPIPNEQILLMNNLEQNNGY